MRRIYIPEPGEMYALFPELRQNGHRRESPTRKERFDSGNHEYDILDVPAIVVVHYHANKVEYGDHLPPVEELLPIDGQHRAVAATARGTGLAAYLLVSGREFPYVRKGCTDLPENRLRETADLVPFYRKLCQRLGVDRIKDLAPQYSASKTGVLPAQVELATPEIRVYA